MIKMKNMADQKEKEEEQQLYDEAKKPAALFGSHSSGLHTSIDTVDVKMMGNAMKDEENDLLNAANYKQTI